MLHLIPNPRRNRVGPMNLVYANGDLPVTLSHADRGAAHE